MSTQGSPYQVKGRIIHSHIPWGIDSSKSWI